jgi:hypothetical protein
VGYVRFSLTNKGFSACRFGLEPARLELPERALELRKPDWTRSRLARSSDLLARSLPLTQVSKDGERRSMTDT